MRIVRIKRGLGAFYVTRTVFGGNGNQYHTLRCVDSVADIGKGPVLVCVLGSQLGRCKHSR